MLINIQYFIKKHLKTLIKITIKLQINKWINKKHETIFFEGWFTRLEKYSLNNAWVVLPEYSVSDLLFFSCRLDDCTDEEREIHSKRLHFNVFCYFLRYTWEESIGFAKIFHFQFSMDLHVLRCPEHDMTIFRKCLSVCLYYVLDAVS